MYKNEIVYKRNRKKKCVEFNVFKSFFFWLITLEELSMLMKNEYNDEKKNVFTPWYLFICVCVFFFFITNWQIDL